MKWWEVTHNEDGRFEVRQVSSPYACSSRWRWVQFDWNDGSRSCFCNVRSPWKWLAMFLAIRVIKRHGCSEKRWKVSTK